MALGHWVHKPLHSTKKLISGEIVHKFHSDLFNKMNLEFEEIK